MSEVEKPHHWYVTYTFNDATGHGDGAMTMHTSEPWFPIGQSMTWIKGNIKAESVIIRGWRRISAQQHEEYAGAIR